jgi:tryptophanase
MADIKYYSGESFPVEMHKTRIIQRLNLVPIEQRLEAITEAGYNTFLLQNKDIFLDMLTDSGVNAMSDRQLSAMMAPDDSYAGSATFTRLQEVTQQLFGKKYLLPAHQGRACEHLISKVYVSEGDIIPMNYHFTTTKVHIELQGGEVVELHSPDAFEIESTNPFKGNMPPELLRECIAQYGVERIPFVRMEAGTNLIGGQPFALANLKEIYGICKEHDLLLVLDASLLADNLYFIKVREAAYKDAEIKDILREIADNTDILYFSARKLGQARGGGICTSDEYANTKIRELIPVYEGFLTYGGMSVREMEAIAVGLEEVTDYHMISQGPQFIEHMVNELKERGVPVVTPSGGLGCHVDAMQFVDHVPQSEYPAGALAAATYIAGGIRGMERGTLSEVRLADGSDKMADMELLRLALPRRVFTLSQVQYAVDRISWLYENRHLIGGLRFVEEPSTLRFFLGKLEPTSDWQDRLVAKFKEDLGESL